jgi:MFS family permease
MIAVLNTASVPGVIIFSTLSDRYHVSDVILMSTLGSAISVFTLWGLSSSSNAQPLLITFAIVYGFFAGGFTATSAGMIRELRIVAPPGAVDLGSVVGLWSAGRGLGNVVCGPLSEALLKGGAGKMGRKVFAYESPYNLLVIFTGTTAVLAITPWITRKLHLV